jgi:CBS domain-containing protein
MTRELVTVGPDLPLTRVLQELVETRNKSLPVLDGTRLVGVVAREDVLRALRRAAAGERPQGD